MFSLSGCGGSGGSSAPTPSTQATTESISAPSGIALIANDPSKAAYNLTTLQTAINAAGVNGDTIQIPCGFYYIAPGIVIGVNQKSITISGCTNGMGYESLVTSSTDYHGGTVLYFYGSGLVGFDMTAISGAGNYTRFTNIVISGGGGVVACFKVSGQAIFDHSNIQDCKNKGVWAYELINSLTIDHVSFTNNIYGEGNGMYVGAGVVTLNDNTKFSVTNSVFRQNNVGMDIEQAEGYTIQNNVFESNNREGLIIGRLHTGNGHGRNTNGLISSNWFENNGIADDGYANLNMDASVRSFDVYDTPSYIVFENNTFISYPSTTHPGWFHQNVLINCGQYITFSNNAIQTADPLVDGAAHASFSAQQYSSYIKWYNVQGNYTITNYGFMNSF
ncbi:MAG: hypothetical protein ACXU8A_00010 [Burkholderiaceae bacterium]